MRYYLALLLVAVPLHARSRSVHFTVHQRIVWIAAHPDDDVLIAPLIGRKCAEEGAVCTIVVLTRGEAGDCKLPGGCADLGSLRAAEMAAAGALLHARVVQWSLPDVFNPEEAWPDITADLRSVITAERPDVIYTFDPNHGSSCHPAHRYTARLVLRAAAGFRVVFVETAILRGARIDFAPATSSAAAFDARPSWSWLGADLRMHQSQFSAEDIASIVAMPENERMIWLLDATAASAASYDFRCE